jgi:hypothetical protein
MPLSHCLPGCRRQDYDTDGDGACNSKPNGTPAQLASWCGIGFTDNCPRIKNPTQVNADGDALGDSCDLSTFGRGWRSGVPVLVTVVMSVWLVQRAAIRRAASAAIM